MSWLIWWKAGQVTRKLHAWVMKRAVASRKRYNIRQSRKGFK